MEVTGEKKPAEVGGPMAGGAEPEVPAVSLEMIWAGEACLAGLDLYGPETLVEEIYIAMEKERQKGLRPS
ncbi:hypothetical protein [Alicycliphilus denitrificans]|uniref:hypothetical protein n=1 Tax=Alicycliphilus denitrificans TaxID=179636 RepID=UPI003A7F9BE2